MNPRRAFTALAGGVGLVIGVLGVAVVVAVALVALGIPDEVRADDSPASCLPPPPRLPPLSSSSG